MDNSISSRSGPLQVGVLATVTDGRGVKLKGVPGHPVNQGWICLRSRAFIEHLYHEDRLNYPLKCQSPHAGQRRILRLGHRSCHLWTFAVQDLSTQKFRTPYLWEEYLTPSA